MLTAWRTPGVLDATITLPFGEVPGSVGASINFIDVLVHGWDLAKATSQDRRLEPHLAEPALTLARGIVNDQLRTAGAFGPEVGVAADAPMGTAWSRSSVAPLLRTSRTRASRWCGS